MSATPKLYIAGMGMVTPVGGNVAMTAAAVNAGVSGYELSKFSNVNKNPVTMALVPWQLFAELDVNIDEGERFNEQHDRIIRMAIYAIREACADHKINAPIPLLLSMPDIPRDLSGLPSLTQSLTENCAPIVEANLTRSFYSGRAAGIEAIDFAFDYLLNANQDFILIGGSDSHLDYGYLDKLDRSKRLLSVDNPDGFVPGEGAGFLLLTPHSQLAKLYGGKIIALQRPAIAEESGHLYSEEVYRGDGLDHAFKQALFNRQKKNIQNIYSSMNGETYWVREMGVAQMRNKKYFVDDVKIKHPADCYGDLGSASAPVLIALAAENLCKSPTSQAHLVYSSSDTAKRGAIVVEKYNPVAMNSGE
ncbi:MAG: hypothetical protein EOO68_34125 [Moraxellaceae bacterium]|nr:MAG: hypothetical protein EOO68_34125 [Moraxellaceae bacterium]